MTDSRDHALDNLRTFVIFLVIVLHAALCYMAHAPEWWYVLDPKRSILFTQMVLLIDVPIMLILFFLSGYFAYPSLVRRGVKDFLREKGRRIGAPWVVGVLVLAPPTAYFIYLSRHIPVSLFDFWRTDFWGPVYQQSVYWYLGILIALYVLTALLFSTSRRFATWPVRTVQPSWWLFALFVLTMSAAATFIGWFGYTLDQWTHVYLFAFQPVRTPLYIGYFALGIYGRQRQWFQPGGFDPNRSVWLGAATLSGLFYMTARMAPPHALAPGVINAMTILLFNLLCFTSLLAAIAIFRGYLAGDGRLWRLQARNSYAIYYLHPLLLYPMALALVPVGLPIFVKFVTISLATYVLSLALGAGLLTRLPVLRQMF